jgi:hypothetical protein
VQRTPVACDESTWVIDQNGNAQESGCGNATGSADLNGRRLTIRFRFGPNNESSGTYTWDMSNDCESGSGNLVFDQDVGLGTLTFGSSISRR